MQQDKDDLYGIGPAMIRSLPRVRAENDRMRQTIQEHERKRLEASAKQVILATQK